jgi:hypothetical protein
MHFWWQWLLFEHGGGRVKKTLIRIQKLCLFSTSVFAFSSNADRRRMLLKGDNGEEWLLLGPEKFIEQLDGYNCGPNSVLKMMSIVGRLPVGVVVAELDQAMVRRITMADFRSLLREISDDPNSEFTAPFQQTKISHQ